MTAKTLRFSLFAAVLLGIAGVLIALYGPFGNGSHQPVVLSGKKLREPSPMDLAGVVSPQADGGKGAAASSPAGRSALALSERLQQQLVDAKDWRRFATDALARPAEGGYLYATYVTSLCAGALQGAAARAQEGIRRTVAAKGTVSAEQLSIAERVSTVCAGFAPGEAMEMLNAIKARSQDGLDPLMKAADQLEAAIAGTNRSVVRSAIGAVLETHDPLVIARSQVLKRTMAGDPEAAKAGGWYFDGKVYSNADMHEYADFQLALDLAQCQEGRPCAMDKQMLSFCTTGHICTTDRYVYARTLMVPKGQATDAQFARVAMLEAKVRQALDSANVDAFVRPAAKP